MTICDFFNTAIKGTLESGIFAHLHNIRAVTHGYHINIASHAERKLAQPSFGGMFYRVLDKYDERGNFARELCMKKSKLKIGICLFLFSMMAFATQWYLPTKLAVSYAWDSDGDWSVARSKFLENQIAMQANGSMKPNDTVSVEYSDGTIVDFTMNPATANCSVRCVWSGDPFDPNKQPKVRQGKFNPKGKPPSKLGVTEMAPFPGVAMSINPLPTTITWTITINQYGGACDICSSTYTGETGGGGGGSGGGTGGTIGTGGGGTCSGDDCNPTPGTGDNNG